MIRLLMSISLFIVSVAVLSISLAQVAAWCRNVYYVCGATVEPDDAQQKKIVSLRDV